MSVIPNAKDPDRLQNLRESQPGDSVYHSVANRPIEDLEQRDIDVDAIHKPSRSFRARQVSTPSDQIEVETGSIVQGTTITQQVSVQTLASVPATGGGGLVRIDLIYITEAGVAARVAGSEVAGAFAGAPRPALVSPLHVPLAFIYVDNTPTPFDETIAINTAGAIEDVRQPNGAGRGKPFETTAASFGSDTAGGSAGTFDTVARGNHRHERNVDGTLPEALGTAAGSASVGGAQTYAPRDHRHAIDVETNPAIFQPDVAGGAAGGAPTLANAAHQHPTNLSINPADITTDSAGGSLGTSDDYASANHEHALNVPLAGAPAVLNPGSGAGILGVGSTYAKNDHRHEVDGVLQSGQAGTIKGVTVWGEVDGATGSIQKAGSAGWTSVRLGVGSYRITFSPVLSSAPTIAGSCINAVIARNFQTTAITATTFDVLTSAPGVGPTDDDFSFIAIAT